MACKVPVMVHINPRARAMAAEMQQQAQGWTLCSLVRHPEKLFDMAGNLVYERSRLKVLWPRNGQLDLYSSLQNANFFYAVSDIRALDTKVMI